MIYLPLISVLLLGGPALAAISITRALTTRGHLVLLGICILYGISPFLVTWGGMGLAERFGCSGEAVRFRCPSSSWLGDVISGMFMAHWLVIFAVSSAILGVIGLLISLILKVKRSNANTPATPRTVFHRSRHKVVAGVCYAFAQLWNLPILGVRIVTVILAIVIPGFIFLYFWCWLAFPVEPPSQHPVGEQS
ncbi:MAG TPA: PspC domain-containing protein [Leptolyngbya sp.]|jgi:phage shock protein PspC (stress-responsive transcriptional regulator)|nr:PspC domain-containing protein [Leptolyngbya sp.]